MSTWLTDLGSGIGKNLSDLGTSFSKSIKDMWDGLAQGLSDLWSAISDGFENLSKWLSDLGSDIGDWLADLGTKFAKSIKDMWDGLAKNLTDLWDSIKDIFETLMDIFDFINPFSDKFFLKIAFIPEEGYFSEKTSDLKADLESRFAFMGQIKDAFGAVTQAVTTQQFKGWQVKVPYTGKTLNIIDTTFINAFAPKLRYFTGGFFVIITLIYLIKRGGRVVGAGKGG